MKYIEIGFEIGGSFEQKLKIKMELNLKNEEL